MACTEPQCLYKRALNLYMDTKHSSVCSQEQSFQIYKYILVFALVYIFVF